MYDTWYRISCHTSKYMRSVHTYISYCSPTLMTKTRWTEKRRDICRARTTWRSCALFSDKKNGEAFVMHASTVRIALPPCCLLSVHQKLASSSLLILAFARRFRFAGGYKTRQTSCHHRRKTLNKNGIHYKGGHPHKESGKQPQRRRSAEGGCLRSTAVVAATQKNCRNRDSKKKKEKKT